MTAPSLLDELEGVVRLSELATPGPFVVDDWGDVTANGEDVVARIATNYVEDEPDANLLASAVNFIRTHHTEIAAMAKRLEEVERDVADYLELLAQAQDELCCFHRGMLHETSFDEVQSKRVVRTINRIEPVLKKRAATQEGEG
jgi:hypothetical protein